MDDVVRDATMMGVSSIQPLVTAHTVAHMKTGRAPDRCSDRGCVGEQCRRAVVPRSSGVASTTGWRRTGRDAPSAPRAIRSVEGHPLLTIAGDARDGSLIVGPEGGWSTGEIESAVAPAASDHAGRRTLRADAIPIVAIGLLQFMWGIYRRARRRITRPIPSNSWTTSARPANAAG